MRVRGSTRHLSYLWGGRCALTQCRGAQLAARGRFPSAPARCTGPVKGIMCCGCGGRLLLCFSRRSARLATGMGGTKPQGNRRGRTYAVAHAHLRKSGCEESAAVRCAAGRARAHMPRIQRDSIPLSPGRERWTSLNNRAGASRARASRQRCACEEAEMTLLEKRELKNFRG